MEGKVCTKCGVWKPLEEYHKCSKVKDGRKSQCKECTNKTSGRRTGVEIKEGMKKCTRCKVWKPLEEYYERKTSKDGRQYKCRECQKEYKKRWDENNKEHIKEKTKQWRENNPEHGKRWRENNPEYQKQWRENNKEHIEEYQKQWRENNKEYTKEYNKQYHQDNVENNLEYISSIVEPIRSIFKELNLPVYGYIYKFENIKTRHTYIGQTIQPLNRRYKKGIINGWIKDRKEKQNQKFLEELIEEDIIVTELFDVACCQYHLDKLEAYWINYYDSYNNGYNNNLGHYKSDDGLEEFQQILSTHNLEYKDGKVIKKPTSTNEID